MRVNRQDPASQGFCRHLVQPPHQSLPSSVLNGGSGGVDVSELGSDLSERGSDLNDPCLDNGGVWFDADAAGVVCVEVAAGADGGGGFEVEFEFEFEAYVVVFVVVVVVVGAVTPVLTAVAQAEKSIAITIRNRGYKRNIPFYSKTDSRLYQVTYLFNRIKKKRIVDIQPAPLSTRPGHVFIFRA